MPGKRKAEDMLTARMVADEYGVPLTTAESMFRRLGAEGKVYRMAGIRRVFVKRCDVEPQNAREAS